MVRADLLNDVVRIIADLNDNDLGTPAENTEYVRGQLELACDLLGLPMESGCALLGDLAIRASEVS